MLGDLQIHLARTMEELAQLALLLAGDSDGPTKA